MPFEDFYKAADRQAHRWRQCLIAAFFFIAAYFGLPVFVSWLFTAAPKSPASLVRTPSDRSWRGGADEICKNLPKPEQFFLTGIEEKKTGDDSATVVYTYLSERSFEEVLPPFLIWFNENNFQRVYDVEHERRDEISDQILDFWKGSRRVSLFYYGAQKKIEIACTIDKPL